MRSAAAPDPYVALLDEVRYCLCTWSTVSPAPWMRATTATSYITSSVPFPSYVGCETDSIDSISLV
jgi:hypothetical protein